MGKFRKRVQNKGKRWIKGQSSTSNPVLKVHRSSAKNNFFKEDLSGAVQGTLTVDSLRRHNDLTSSSNYLSSATSSVIDGASTNTSYRGSTKTFNSFASDWSCCSNITFNKLLNRFDLSSAHHKEMLAVLAAVTEVIKANGGQENNIEYFAALMTTLDGINLDEPNDDSVSAVLSLIAMCIKNVPKEILQVKFSAISKTFSIYLKHYEHSEHNIIVKSLLGCLTTLLRLQDRVVWNDSSTFHIFDSILPFAIHNKSKIRKAGQHAVLAILKGSDFCKEENSSPHPAAKHTAKRCNEVLKENKITEGGFTIITHTLNLLRDIISIFPKPELVECCNAILGLMKAGNPILKSLGLQTLHGLFSAKPSVSCFPATLNAKIINALYDDQPSFVDVQQSMAWFSAMQEAFINLARNDLELAMSNIPKFFKDCSNALLSTKQEVINNAAICLGAVLKDCVELAATEEHVQSHVDSIRKIYEILNHCLKYQYSAAWKQILFLLARFYKVCGKTCQSFMVDCLVSLAALRETNDFGHENEVDHVFGCAIESIGPEIIINKFPVQIIEYQSEKYEVKYSWLLPLLKQCTKHTRLAVFFKNDNLFPRAMAYRKRSEDLGKANRKVGERTYDLLQSQIWALLPSFCDEAQDIRESFPEFGSVMMTMLGRNDVSTLIMAALRKLIQSCTENEQDQAVMIRYAKNCIVALFNMYADSDDKAIRNAAADTLKKYLSVCNDGVYEGAYVMLMKKLKSNEAPGETERERLLDLIRLLIPYLPREPLDSLFENYMSEVREENLKLKEEKKYYRLLEEMCTCRSERCNEYIRENFAKIKALLLENVSKAPLPCRGPRIRVAKALLFYDSNEQIISEFLPEAVMCCKEVNNVRCRTSAFDLITHMATLMADNLGEEGVGKYLDAISSGLVGSTSMIAATVLALTCTVHIYQDRIVKDQFDVILNNICLLAKCKTREIVEPTLGFLKSVITAKKMDYVVGNLELIVKTLSGITEDCKRRYRQKIRDIYDRLVRKFGAAMIITVLPKHDAVAMSRLKALKKEQDRKQRKQQEAKKTKTSKKASSGATDDLSSVFSAKRKSQTIDDILAECDNDDDVLADEDSDVDTKTKKRPTNNKVYLTEDVDSIIDFTSPTANKNITMGDPSKIVKTSKTKMTKKTETDFPIAPDGRLVIVEKKEERTNKVDLNSDEESIASDAEAQGSLSRMLKNVGISRKRKMSESGDVEEEDQPSRKYQAGGSGIHRKINKDTKSKKKKNDSKNNKEKLDPYTYIPLSRNALNRRKKKKAAGQFKNVVHRGKRGKRK